MTLDFYDFLDEVERRRNELGIACDPRAIDALRNKGDRRSPQKRVLLQRMEQRAREAGIEPIPA